jgi:hypothetical protein
MPVDSFFIDAIFLISFASIFLFSKKQFVAMRIKNFYSQKLNARRSHLSLHRDFLDSYRSHNNSYQNCNLDISVAKQLRYNFSNIETKVIVTPLKDKEDQ